MGILLVAALFFLALQRAFLGTPRLPDEVARFGDARTHELLATAPLLVLAFVIGVLPHFLLDVIEPGARMVVELVSR